MRLYYDLHDTNKKPIKGDDPMEDARRWRTHRFGKLTGRELMKMVKILRNVALGALAAVTMSGVYGDTALAADKIKVGALRFTSHSASFVAFERGYFKKNDLDVEFIFFQAAQPMAVAIASGDVDFGVTAISGGLINLANKGAVNKSSPFVC